MLRQFIIVLTLGLCVTLGNSFAAQSEQDIQSITQKAIQGDADAQFNLGVIYYNGNGVSQDYAQALQWYEKAAQQGDAKAQYNLGYMYDIGQGVRQDYAQARQWYEKAAQQGVANAQFALGIMYNIGQGVRQDYAQAQLWYEKAAQQGDANAQYNLGVMYYNGNGVSQDYAQARQWFEKAAQQDHASSLHILNLMHSNTSTKTVKQNDPDEQTNKPAELFPSNVKKSGSYKPFAIMSSKLGKEMSDAHIANNFMCKTPSETIQETIELLQNYDLIDSSKTDGTMTITSFRGIRQGEEVIVSLAVDEQSQPRIVRYILVDGMPVLHCY